MIELASVFNYDLYSDAGLDEKFTDCIGPARKIARYLILRASDEYFVKIPSGSKGGKPKSYSFVSVAQNYCLDVAAALHSGIQTQAENRGLGYAQAATEYFPWADKQAERKLAKIKGPLPPGAYAQALDDIANNDKLKAPLPVTPEVVKIALDRHFKLPLFEERLDDSWKSLVSEKRDGFIGWPRAECEGWQIIRRSGKIDKTSIGMHPLLFLTPFYLTKFFRRRGLSYIQRLLLTKGDSHAGNG